MYLRFEGDLNLWAGIALGAVLAVAVALLYRREVRKRGRAGVLLPVLRAATILFILLMLTGPVIRGQNKVGDRSRVLVFVDESQSMSLTDTTMTKERKLANAEQLGWLEYETDEDESEENEEDDKIDEAIQRFDETTRWQRIESHLMTDDEGLLTKLTQEHQVELLTTSGATDDDDAARRVWSPDQSDLPESLTPASPEGASTNLVDGIQHAVGKHGSDQRLAVVLWSDGQHNFDLPHGTSPLHFAKLMGSRGVPIFTVGVGAATPPRDLAVLAVNGPQSVFVDDRVKGEILIKDNMLPGEPLTVKIELDSEVVWRDQLTTNGSHRRTVEFDFSIKTLVEDRLARSTRDVDVVSLPLAMNVTIEPLDGESRDDNNASELHVRAITRPRRILLVDGRPRWEFRYLRNQFERDEQWEVRSVLVETDDSGAQKLPRGNRPGEFPTERDELFSYDLLVFGEVPRSAMRAEELEWINQFVSSRGGGVVFIDGRREKLRGYADTPIEPLLPIKWTSSAKSTSRCANLLLTDRGQATTALHFEGATTSDSERWTQLPPPMWIAAVSALPGAEVLVEAAARDAEENSPALVLRRFGAGTVLYSAFDETWSWRYEVADFYHQRFWNQIANFVMEPPYAVHDQFVSIDTGGFTYEQGEQAQIRVRLRDKDGQPVIEAAAEALLYQDEEIVAIVPLEADQSAGGVFRATTEALDSGIYNVGVRATGFTDDHLTARAAFAVQGEPTGEMNVLYCDEELLRQVARLSGGKYFREEDADQLPEQLEHLSDYRVEERETLLWRSWWWFLPIVGLLTIEWIVRKRIGLM